MADKDKSAEKTRTVEDAVPATRPLLDLAERIGKRAKKSRTPKGRDQGRR